MTADHTTRTARRVDATPRATALVQQLCTEHGELLFHQSGGCCDGSAPMLLKKEDMYINETDVFLGKPAGVPFYMNQDQFEYWKHTHITVDVTEGRGASFSLEIPLGVRFIIHSRLFTDDEITMLQPVSKGAV